MTVRLYFDAPPQGLNDNPGVADEWVDNASADSLIDRDALVFAMTADHMVVEWDTDPGNASAASKTALQDAVEAQYGVRHISTEGS